MKHRSTRDLFNYWNERRNRRPAPERCDIEPGPIRRALGDTFILSFNPAVGHPFRLAGTRLCALFCRELRGHSFVDLWAQSAQQELGTLTALLGTESSGFVAGASARNADGSTIALELLMLPLSHRGRIPARLLGVLAPLAVPYWLGLQPLAELSLNTVRHLDPDVLLAPAFGAGQRHGRSGFVVYPGGRP
jgi:hypothetical protein